MHRAAGTGFHLLCLVLLVGWVQYLVVRVDETDLPPDDDICWQYASFAGPARSQLLISNGRFRHFQQYVELPGLPVRVHSRFHWRHRQCTIQWILCGIPEGQGLFVRFPLRFDSTIFRTDASSSDDATQHPVANRLKRTCAAWCLIPSQSTTSNMGSDERSRQLTSFPVRPSCSRSGKRRCAPARKWILSLLNTALVRWQPLRQLHTLGLSQHMPVQPYPTGKSRMQWKFMPTLLFLKRGHIQVSCLMQQCRAYVVWLVLIISNLSCIEAFLVVSWKFVSLFCQSSPKEKFDPSWNPYSAGLQHRQTSEQIYETFYKFLKKHVIPEPFVGCFSRRIYSVHLCERLIFTGFMMWPI